MTVSAPFIPLGLWHDTENEKARPRGQPGFFSSISIEDYSLDEGYNLWHNSHMLIVTPLPSSIYAVFGQAWSRSFSVNPSLCSKPAFEWARAAMATSFWGF
jgi:hypothetical protein